MTEAIDTTTSTFTARPAHEPDFDPAIEQMLTAPLGPQASDPALADLVTACDWANKRREELEGLDDATFEVEHDRVESVLIRAVNEPSHGLADIGAKARVLLADLSEGGVIDKEYTDSKLIGVVLREVIALANSEKAEPQHDPIFAVIGEARRLCAEHTAACNPDKPADQPDPPEVIDRRDDANDALWAFVDGTLLKTVPTTARGCQALARYVGEFVKDQGVPLHGLSESNDPVFALIARSPMLGGPVDPFPHNDAAQAETTEAMLDTYSEWLFVERRNLCRERYPDETRPERMVPGTEGVNAFYFMAYPGGEAAPPPPASTRAALVLSAVGCDWRPGADHARSVQQKDA